MNEPDRFITNINDRNNKVELDKLNKIKNNMDNINELAEVNKICYFF